MAKSDVKDKEHTDDTLHGTIEHAGGSALVEQHDERRGMTAYLDDMESLSGAGFEDVKTTDLALPFFKLLSSSSDITKFGTASYVKGAREGLWFDTISQRLFKDLTFIPCKFVTHYLEWNREQRGILIKNHGTSHELFDKCTRDEKTGQDIVPGGKSVVVATATWFGLIIGATEIDPTVVDDPGRYVEMGHARAIVGMSGTAAKVSKRWVSDLQSLQLKNSKGNFFTPPMFAMSYIVGSQMTKNDKGSWSLPVINRGGFTLDFDNGKLLFDKAIEFSKFANEYHHMIVNQAADDIPSTDGERSAARTGSSVENPQAPLDDDIPF